MRIRNIVGAAGAALLMAVYTGMTSVLAGRVPGPALALLVPVAALVLALALGWGRVRFDASREAARETARQLAAPAIGGLLSLFLAPYLVLTNRYSDAPPATELIFFTTAGWAAIAIAVVTVRAWRSGDARAWVMLAGALAGAVGLAGVLANWERPSSFSPLVRFASEEVWMLVAGVAFVAGVLLVGTATPRLRPMGRIAATGTASLAALAAFALAGYPGASWDAVMQRSSEAALWAMAGAGVWHYWVASEESGRLRLPAVLTLTPAVILLALGPAERLVGVAGPDPVLWPGALGASLLVAAGVARVLARHPRAGAPGAAQDPAHGRGPLRSVLPAFAGLVVLLAAVGLATPALDVSVVAHRQASGVNLSWTLPGWESVAGLTALSLAVLALASVFDDAWLPGLLSIAAAPAYWLLARVPTHVLSSWLPGNIQQDFGTEYASITFAAITSWPARLAVGGAVLCLAIVLLTRMVRTRLPVAGTADTGSKEGPI